MVGASTFTYMLVMYMINAVANARDCSELQQPTRGIKLKTAMYKMAVKSVVARLTKGIPERTMQKAMTQRLFHLLRT
jgi:hypothetical protein